MKKNRLYIFGMVFLLAFTACGGGSDTPPPSLAASLIGSTWTLATVEESNSSDAKTTFVLQSFTLNSDNTYAATLYPSTSQSGNWTEVSPTAYNLVVNSANLELSNMSITDNTLTATATIAAGTAGKATAFTGTVTYTK